MSRSIVVSATAKKDLDQIWDYIAQDSPDAADRVGDEIELAMFRLSENPGIGHERSDASDPTMRF